MGQAWTIADSILYTALSAWFDTFPDGTQWYVDLYTNDHEPECGDAVADYDLGDWDGYEQLVLDWDTWGDVAVSECVAISYYDEISTWSVDPDEDEQTVYGYVVQSALGDLMWAESFPDALTAPPGGQFLVQLALALAILPVPDDPLVRSRAVLTRRSRTARATHPRPGDEP